MHSPGPVFTVRIPAMRLPQPLRRVIVLEGVQDPGNVGTVIRTANALGMDAVVLTGACADLYGPKTVRATMGALFRQPVLTCATDELMQLLRANGLKLYGAALTDTAQDLRRVPLTPAAVAIGSEGRGLSAQLLAMDRSSSPCSRARSRLMRRWPRRSSCGRSPAPRHEEGVRCRSSNTGSGCPCASVCGRS